MSETKTNELEKFTNNLDKKDKVAVFTMGRFHPFHKGHHELITHTNDLAYKIKQKVEKSQSFVWISPTNKEEGWIKYKDKTILKYLNLIHKAKKNKNKTPRAIRNQMRKNKTSVSRVNKLKKEINKTEPLPTEIRLYYVNKFIENLKNKPIVLVDYEVNSANFKDIKKFPISVREKYGTLYSEKVLNFLKNRGFNKVILLVGSDRIEAFKKYNSKTIKNLFDDGIIIQSGLDRKKAGMGNKAIDDLIQQFKKLNVDDKIIETEKAGMYSGSMSRKLANSRIKEDLKSFLKQIGYKDGDDTQKILQLINYIRKANSKPYITKQKLIEVITDLKDDKINYDEENPFEEGAFGFMGGGSDCKLDRNKKNYISEWQECLRLKRIIKNMERRVEIDRQDMMTTAKGRAELGKMGEDVHTRLRDAINKSEKIKIPPILLKSYNKYKNSKGGNKKRKTRKRKKKRPSKKRLKIKKKNRKTKKRRRKKTKKLKIKLTKSNRKKISIWKVKKR